MKKLCLLVTLALGAGCASGPGVKDRSAARNTLLGVVLVGAAAAGGAAYYSQKKEDDLREELATQNLTGSQFADRDDAGRRWNRIGRASVFVTGLALVGLGILWEMGLGDRMEAGEPIPGANVPLPAAQK